MLAVGAASSAMLDGADVTAEVRATITLPGNVYPDLSLALSDVQVTATDTTSLPDPVHFATGGRVMSASFSLAGPVDPTDDSHDAAWLFGRWQTSSPLWRTDAMYSKVTIDVDLYPDGSQGVPDTVRCFTGVVDHYEALEDGTVSVTCVDYSALLKSLPATPVVATAAPWNAGLTAEFARDAILRAASKAAAMGTVSSWPAQRTRCVLAAGLRSSTWPEVGTINITEGYAYGIPAFAPGKFGSALGPNGPGIMWNFANSITGSDMFVECWVTGVSAPLAGTPLLLQIDEAVPIGNSIDIQIGTDGILIKSWTFTHTWSRAVTSGSHYFAIQINFPKGTFSPITGTMWLDAASHAIPAGTSVSRTGDFATFRAATVSNAALATPPGYIEALQVTTEVGTPALNNTFTPTAVLDPSLNPLDVVPPIAANADPIDTLLQMDEAELGLGGFGPDGIYYFRNRQTLASQPIARTITTLTALTEETQAGAVINRAHVGFTNWSTGKAATVWQAQGRWHIPARATERNPHDTIVNLANPAVNIPTVFYQLPTTGATVKGRNYFDSCLDRNGQTPDPNPPTITATPISSQKVLIRVVNNDSRDKYLVAGSDIVTTTIDGVAVSVGDPVLLLGGQPMNSAGEAVADYQYPAAADGGAASTRFGEQLWELTGNLWIQDDDAAAQLARDVVWDCYVPKPVLSNVTVMADPRLQLGDWVHIQEPDTTGVDEYVRIFGYTLNLTDWTETIAARALGAPGGWLLGVTGRSELGSTTYLPG